MIPPEICFASSWASGRYLNVPQWWSYTVCSSSSPSRWFPFHSPALMSRTRSQPAQPSARLLSMLPCCWAHKVLPAFPWRDWEISCWSMCALLWMSLCSGVAPPRFLTSETFHSGPSCLKKVELTSTGSGSSIPCTRCTCHSLLNTCSFGQNCTNTFRMFMFIHALKVSITAGF